MFFIDFFILNSKSVMEVVLWLKKNGVVFYCANCVCHIHILQFFSSLVMSWCFFTFNVFPENSVHFFCSDPYVHFEIFFEPRFHYFHTRRPCCSNSFLRHIGQICLNFCATQKLISSSAKFFIKRLANVL